VRPQSFWPEAVAEPSEAGRKAVPDPAPEASAVETVHARRRGGEQDTRRPVPEPQLEDGRSDSRRRRRAKPARSVEERAEEL
jgi:hypothetical protein